MAKQQRKRGKIQKRTTSSGKAKARSKHKKRHLRGRRAIKNPVAGARTSLRHFRQATLLAVAITGFILLFFDSTGASQEPADIPDTVSVIEEYTLEDLKASEQSEGDTTDLEEAVDPKIAASEAVDAVEEMFRGFYQNLPRFLMVIVIFILVWLLVKVINSLIRKISGKWDRTEAITTMVGIIFWILGIGIAISILVEDVRALVGSLGLLGLALSWALQSPIESFTGWLLNKFKGYYRIGDRVIVGELIGDVYKIDFLNTTLWEIGDPFAPGFVAAEQPTGRMITFPNNEIVNGVIINFTSDFPYVWDELPVQIANESDLPYAMRVVEGVALGIFEPLMKEPALQYEKILRRTGLEEEVSPKPQIFLSSNDSWTNIVVRYLVHARQRRKWKSELLFEVTNELKKPDHSGKIVTAYPRQQVQFLNEAGVPVNG